MPTNPLIPNDLGYTIRKLEDTVQRQAQRIQQLESNPSSIDRLAQALAEQSARLESLTRAIAHERVAGGEDIPGPRLPRFYTVSVPLVEGSTATANGEAIITNDGPFKCYGVAAYYIPSTDTGSDTSAGAFTNRFLPVSTSQAIFGLSGSSAAFNSTTGISAAFLNAVPDLSFNIQVAGSGRSWTPNVTDVPGGVLFGLTGYNEFVEPALVAGGERIVVTVKPERAMANTGTCRIVFQGYQILTNQPVRY